MDFGTDTDHKRIPGLTARIPHLKAWDTRLFIVKEAVDTAENLAWLASQREEEQEAVTWCERGLALIEESPTNLPEAADSLRTRKEGIKESDQQRLEPLYRTALREAADGDDEEATRLFRKAWDRREELDEGDETFGLALSAGVGLFAEITLLDIEETTDAEANIVGEIDPVRERLTEPADGLFTVLVEEAPATEYPDALADARPVGRAETTTELEVTAYAELLDRLRGRKTQPPHRPETDATLSGRPPASQALAD